MSNYICPATFIRMTITSIVSHSPGAFMKGPVCYDGAEENLCQNVHFHDPYECIPNTHTEVVDISEARFHT
jgi:hypothetical protein